MMPKIYRDSVQNKHGFVFIFFVLVFVLSIPFWVLGMINPIQLLPGLPISALGVFTPALSALILVYKNERLSGVLQLLGRSFDFKRVQNKRWYLAFILINPVIAILAYGLMRAVGKSIPNPTLSLLAIFPMFVLFFISALGEEIGWTGYATEPLQRRWGIAIAGLALGSIWAIWHFIPLVQAHRSLDWIAWWSLGTISLRMIMVWLYFHAGKSVFAAAVFHAMINLCWQLFPNNGSYYDPRVFGLITFCLAIAIFTAQRLSRKGRMSTA
jgi:membrane protease YdiL (CAAX protease family)